MSMFAVILALALEQWKPTSRTAWSRIDRLSGWAAQVLPERLDGGRDWHAWLGWSVFVGAAAAITGLAGWLLGAIAGWLQALFIVAVLYFTIGFRVFSRHFGAVRDGLAARRLDLAGAALAHWQGGPLAPTSGIMPATTPETIARQAIERGIGETERWLFGGVFWFALLSGASGAVLYRAADRIARHWDAPPAADAHPGFARVALSALRWLDAMPARLAAGAFALVGDFTGAAEGWQAAVRDRPGEPRELIVAAAFGALGMGGASAASVPAASSSEMLERFDGAGWDADSYAVAVAQMDGAGALVWRSLLVWLAGLGLIALVA